MLQDDNAVVFFYKFNYQQYKKKVLKKTTSIYGDKMLKAFNKNMFKILWIMFFTTTISINAQQQISGIILDSNTNEPLPFASIITNHNLGTVTDIDGKFELNAINPIEYISIEYLGYETKRITITDKSYYKISLKETAQALNEVVVVAKENPALEIIRNTIKRKTLNNPEEALESFQFKSYSKLLVTANPDSIRGSVDSVFVKQDGKLVFKEIDSSNYELKKTIERNHIYLAEKISEDKFKKSTGRKETVLATRMAGLQNPIYELLALNIQDFSFYNNKYTLFGTDYVNPIAKNALNSYKYKILDTVTIQNQDAYMIYFKPKKKGDLAGLEGVLYLNMKTLAIQKAIAQLKGVIDVKAVQEFEYKPEYNIWFPIKKEIKMNRGKGDDNIAFFNGNVTFTNPKRDSTIVRNNKDQGDKIYLYAKADHFDITINPKLKIKNPRVAIEIDEEATNRDEAYWKRFRTDSITTRGKETYVVLDSIVKEEKIEEKIYLARKLLQGYYPTKYVDLDLRYLLKFNQYEGLRVGLGGITNNNLSRKFRLEGYTVYGFRDKAVKFSAGGGFRLNKTTNTWLNLSYTDDLQETGSKQFLTDRRLFQLFEPRLINIDLFHRHKTYQVNLEHQLTPKLSSVLDVSKSSIYPTYNYSYIENGNTYSDYKLSIGTLAFQWNPFSEYMQTPDGRSEIKRGFPKFTAQVTQSFNNFLEGDLSFTKFDFRTLYEINRINNTSTSFLLELGLAKGNTPLTHLYHAYPNNVNKDRLLQRFSVAGRTSFETMYFNEFFSDRLATFQVKHRFAPFKISRKFRPELILISRFAIGHMSNQERHNGIAFNTLEKGYTESGFEINKLFKGFGLSFAYRYGAYHLPEFEDNLALNFTYYFSF